MKTEKKDNFGFVPVAAACPKLRVGNTNYNADETIKSILLAKDQEAKIIVLPELGITGYTNGDLFANETLLDNAIEALMKIRFESTAGALVIVGLLLRVDSGLYNVAAVIGNQEILGFVPKTHIPTYKEFYERRHFQSARSLRSTTVRIDCEDYPIGQTLSFSSRTTLK